MRGGACLREAANKKKPFSLRANGVEIGIL
jgi:hypothetical protein